MQEVSKDIFYKLIADFEWIPYTQTLAYNLSIVDESTLHWYIDDVNNPTIGCVGYERYKMGMKMLCVAGECRKEMNSINRKRYAAFYQDLHDTGFDIYEVNISTPYSVDAEIALRTTGWLRPVGLFSTTLSKIVPTNQPLTLDKSWKHNLKKAHEASLLFSVQDKIDAQCTQDFLTLHKELQRYKGFSEHITESGLLALGHDSHFKMAVVTDTNNRTLAGCIFYACPNTSSTIYSFSTPEGREHGAAYLLREGIVQFLAQQGINELDLGRLSPATHKKNNLFLFKDGIGGEYVQYLGEWQWCKSRWMPLALYFMKKYIWKRVQV